MPSLTNQYPMPTTDLSVSASNVTQCRRPRVLHVVNGEYYAGAERVQDLLGQHLPRSGCDVGFVCVKADQFVKQRQCQSVPLEVASMRHPWDVAGVTEISRILRDGGYDIIHSHTPRSAWAASAAAKSNGCPFVHTLHDVSLGGPANIARRAINAWTISLVRKADMVTTVSMSTADLADRLQLGKRRRKILNGVPAARSGFRRIKPGTNAIWNLGTAALIRPCKGIEILVRGVAELRKRGCPVRSTIVGDFHTDAYRQDVMKLVADLGIGDGIKFVGFQNDVPTQLEKFDLFVIPSVGPEGLPMVLLESMAHGLPAIASAVAGIKEVVDEGVDGVLFSPGDAAELADKVELFLNGSFEYQTMAENARERHHREFSANQMASQFAKIYQDLLSP